MERKILFARTIVVYCQHVQGTDTFSVLAHAGQSCFGEGVGEWESGRFELAEIFVRVER